MSPKINHLFWLGLGGFSLIGNGTTPPPTEGNTTMSMNETTTEMTTESTTSVTSTTSAPTTTLVTTMRTTTTTTLRPSILAMKERWSEYQACMQQYMSVAGIWETDAVEENESACSFISSSGSGDSGDSGSSGSSGGGGDNGDEENENSCSGCSSGTTDEDKDDEEETDSGGVDNIWGSSDRPAGVDHSPTGGAGHIPSPLPQNTLDMSQTVIIGGSIRHRRPTVFNATMECSDKRFAMNMSEKVNATETM